MGEGRPPPAWRSKTAFALSADAAKVCRGMGGPLVQPEGKKAGGLVGLHLIQQFL